LLNFLSELLPMDRLLHIFFLSSRLQLHEKPATFKNLT